MTRTRLHKFYYQFCGSPLTILDCYHILLKQWSADSCCVFQVWSDNGFVEVAEHVMVHVSESSKDYSQVSVCFIYFFIYMFTEVQRLINNNTKVFFTRYFINFYCFMSSRSWYELLGPF